MRFPELLWTLVNECDSGAIAWNETGVSIVLDYLKFKEEFMRDTGIFKTSNIASFVRQLNLYGFKKCNRQENYENKTHEFQHPLFVKGRQDLMCRMKRKPFSMSEKKFFRRPSKINNESTDKISEYHKNPKKSSKSTPKTKTPEETSIGPIGYLQPSSSLEQIQKYWWNNSIIEANMASTRNAPFPHSWMSPAFYNPRNWNRNLSEEPGNHENCFYGNLPPYGYPVLQRGDENAYYLLMSGHAPFGYMHQNMDFYRNAMPVSGIPINMESNGAGDEDPGDDIVIP